MRHIGTLCLIISLSVDTVRSNCIFQLKSRTKIKTKALPERDPDYSGTDTESLELIQTCSDEGNCAGYFRANVTVTTDTTNVEYKFYKVTVGDDISAYVNEDVSDGDYTEYYVKTESCTDAGAYSVDLGVGEKCPALGGNHTTVDCPLVTNTTDENLCTAQSEYCCWDSANSKCHVAATALCNVGLKAKYDQTGTILESFDVQTIRPDNQQIYLGEYVEIQCKAPRLFSAAKGFEVDTDSKTKLFCNVDKSNQKMTDLFESYEQISCSKPCNYTKLEVDEATQSVSFEKTVLQRFSTEYTLSCNDGFGFSNGFTSITTKCDNYALNDDYKCGQCTVPLYDTQKFTHTTATPTEKVTSTCNDGYSYNKQTTETKTCNIDKEFTFGRCVADCVINRHDTSKENLHFDVSRTLTCPDGQDYLVSDKTASNHIFYCETEGTTFTEPTCHTICKLKDTNIFSDSKTVLDGDTTITQDSAIIPTISPGAKFRIKCLLGKALQEGVSDEISCSENFYDSSNTGREWINIPQCYDRCNVDPTEYAGVEVTYNGQKKTSLFKINYNEKITAKCVEDSYTFFDSTESTMEITCEEDQIQIPACVVPCKSDEITGIDMITSNTKITPESFKTNGILGRTSTLKMSCQSGYVFPSTKSDEEVNFGLCNLVGTDSVYEPDITINSDYICLAKPTIKSIRPDGDKSLLVTYGLPNGYDQVKGSPTKFEGKKYKDEDAIEISSDAGCLPTCTTKLENLNEEKPVQMSIIATYNPTVESEVFQNVYPLRSAVISGVSAIGASKVKFTIKDGITDDTFRSAANKGVTYRVEVKDGPTTKSTSTISALEVDNTDKEKTASIQDAKSLTTYNLVIGTYDANNNFGGETVQAFTTGYGKAVLTHNLISSTSNEVTIALPDGKTTSAVINVDIEISGNTDQKSLTFTNGKAKYLMEDLTAKTSYTIKVKIYNNGVAGDEAMLSFSQGPSEVENISEDFPTIDSVSLTWDEITGAKYLVKLADKDGTVLNGEKYSVEVAEAKVTFDGLSRDTTYKVHVTTEQEVDGTPLQSDVKEHTFSTFACALTDKDGFKLLMKSAGSDTAGAQITTPYLKADDNTQFFVQCSEDGYELEVSEGLSVDNVTSCDGPNSWSFHDICVQSGASTSSNNNGLIVGVVIAVLCIFIILIVIVVLIKKKRRENTVNKSHKKYSPRAAEEKQNVDPVDEGGDTWRNPYYNDVDENGVADIPENGDNVSNRSVEAKVTFNEDEDNVIVNPNNPVENV